MREPGDSPTRHYPRGPLGRGCASSSSYHPDLGNLRARERHGFQYEQSLNQQALSPGEEDFRIRESPPNRSSKSLSDPRRRCLLDPSIPRGAFLSPLSKYHRYGIPSRISAWHVASPL